MRKLIRVFSVLGIFLLAALAPGLGYGANIDPPLDDPALEARAQNLFKDLRCLVCQNQSISDSNADLARDLRVIVRERVMAGDSDAQARAYLVDRYGDWVLLKPPFKGTTVLLWLGPLVLAGVALLIAVGFYRGRKSSGTESVAPLSAQERQRLRSIVDETGDGKP